MKTTFVLMLMLAACGCARKETDVNYGAMVLDICGTRKIENPTDEQIRTELGHLSTQNEDSFAMLGPSDMTYIQISGDKSVGFDLEYQDASVDAHFRATDENITLDQVVEAFMAYRDGSTNWQTTFTFEKITW